MATKSEYQKLLERIAKATPAMKQRLKKQLRILREREARNNTTNSGTRSTFSRDIETARTRQQQEQNRLNKGIKEDRIGAAAPDKRNDSNRRITGSEKYTVSGITYNRDTGRPDTYTVSGITYNRDTGKPIQIDKNRQPVRAQDNTQGESNQTESTTTSAADSKKPKHGAHSDKINTLMKAWGSAKTNAEKDRLGKQIHRLKYEKTGSGLKIRKKKISRAAQAGWPGRSER